MNNTTAGFFSSINQTRYSYQLINAAFGGHEYWVGPGAAAFIKVRAFPHFHFYKGCRPTGNAILSFPPAQLIIDPPLLLCVLLSFS